MGTATANKKGVNFGNIDDKNKFYLVNTIDPFSEWYAILLAWYSIKPILL